MQISISEKIGQVSCEVDEPQDPKYNLILAHGAGAPMVHPFMATLAGEISSLSGNVIRFNFPYIEKGRKAPGSPGPSIETIARVADFTMENYPDLPVFLSGKSYGGRMSSHLVAEQLSIPVRGLIYFGFPLHAPGRDSKDRAEHLYSINLPQLFFQGTRDSLANYEMIREVIAACKEGTLVTIEDGDHSFKVRKKVTGLSHDEVIKRIAFDTNSWILGHL